MTPPSPPDEIDQLMRFVANKAKNVTSPMTLKEWYIQFKDVTGSTLSFSAVEQRLRKNRQRIHKIDEFDMDTKVKMIFALSAPIDKGFLNELKKQADVEVDEKGKITKYIANDGSLTLEGNHGMSSIKKSMHFDRWQKACQKANDDESEKDDNEDANGQKDYENKRVDLAKFLIARTKNATSPWSLEQLSKDYKEEFKCSESLRSIRHQITRFRRHIHKMNQFDMPTKVKMLFAMSASIDAEFLKELQKDAVVELDGNQKIRKYKAKDGSLKVEGDHSGGAKRKATWANKKKKKKMSVVNDQSDSEEDEGDKDSSETDGSDEEDDEGNVGGSLKSNQPSTSLPKRRSQKFRKSTVSTSSNNKKRVTTIQKQSSMDRKRKRARIANASSERSENDEESIENDPSMNSEPNDLDNGGDDFDYDAPANNHYDEDLEHNVTDPNSGGTIEIPKVTDDVEEGKKEKESSASSSAEIESMSLLELLNHLRSPITQYTPNLAHKIDENIEKLESKDQLVPFHLIIESLKSCIQILNTPDEMDSDENRTSLSDFYYHLGMAMCNITHSMMDDFQTKMRKLATTGDEKVSMEHIRFAMGKTIDKILH